MLISLRNIKKTYGKGDLETCAIRGINLDIDEGEMVAIMGPSGSGKSTLLNIIGCIDKASGGSYLFRDKDISDYDSKSLARIRNEEIGFVFQSFNLLEEYNLVENTILPLLYRKGSKRGSKLKGEEMLSKVELLEHKKKRPSQLSGGQQQRVAIARAIAAKPPLILADEPTGNLDSHSGRQIMDILLELNSNGKTIILITHDKEIAKLIPRRINIVDGRIV